ncbi:hypothetical protein HanIR_Chr16g0809781 [Helianthus annuus]|nr:hypothetical protein HanIR_Chr16g0809781 [Helianthus annuus]
MLRRDSGRYSMFSNTLEENFRNLLYVYFIKVSCFYMCIYIRKNKSRYFICILSLFILN